MIEGVGLAQADFSDLKALLGVVGIGALLIGLVVWVIKSGVKEGIQATRRPAAAPHPAPRPTRGFPVVADGPGKYRVEGVDKETQLDVVEYIDAQSPANAQAKAGLRGIIVTAIERVES